MILFTQDLHLIVNYICLSEYNIDNLAGLYWGPSQPKLRQQDKTRQDKTRQDKKYSKADEYDHSLVLEKPVMELADADSFCSAWSQP